MECLKSIVMALFHFFWQRDFGVAFFSSLAVVGVVAIITYNYTNIFKRPNLVMLVKQDGMYHDKIQFTKNADGSYVAVFQLAIKNTGSAPVKANEGYWHTYILSLSSTSPVAFSAPGEPDHQRGIIDYTIYPQWITDISAMYSLTIFKGQKPQSGVRYFFQTDDYGNFPNTAKLDLQNGQIINMDDIGLLEFQIPQ